MKWFWERNAASCINLVWVDFDPHSDEQSGSAGGAMGRAWVFQTRGLVFDSRRTAVVSGRASALKCSCATLVYKTVDPH